MDSTLVVCLCVGCFFLGAFTVLLAFPQYRPSREV